MEIQTKGASKKQAQIVLDCDLISEFRIIKELIQQRAELLEALKAAKKKGSRWHPTDQVVQQINAAIKKAEATE